MDKIEVLEAKVKHYEELAYCYKVACRELVRIIEKGFLPTSVIDRYGEVGQELAHFNDKHDDFVDWLAKNT